MLRSETVEQEAFRCEVRSWLDVHLPTDLRFLTFRPPPSEAMLWHRLLSRRGWIAPHWPKEHGGMAASPVEQVILFEELARAGAPDIPAQGLNHIGPILIKLGSPEQKARHLPPIISGDVIWCQGYSEPNAGSDLASLRTQADVEGDHLIINGQKTWTTWGQHADWMFALVRTGEGSHKKEGITFVLVDMNAPGITRRPIRTIAFDEELSEVFFENVRVPVTNVVGEIGKGWTIATAVLAQERLLLGCPALALRAVERLRRLIRLGGAHLDDRQRDLVARAEIEVEVLTACFLDAAENADDDRATADASYLKILASETTQFVLDVLQEIAGSLAAMRSVIQVNGERIDLNELFLQSRRLTIYGGTSEIQRTIIATRTLRLPS
jgi:alkylation response protein AidB-like acyl-CoA dehydrogenase